MYFGFNFILDGKSHWLSWTSYTAKHPEHILLAKINLYYAQWVVPLLSSSFTTSRIPQKSINLVLKLFRSLDHIRKQKLGMIIITLQKLIQFFFISIACSSVKLFKTFLFDFFWKISQPKHFLLLLLQFEKRRGHAVWIFYYLQISWY